MNQPEERGEDESNDPRDYGGALRSYERIIGVHIRTAMAEYRRPAWGLILSSFSAGLILGVSVLLMATVHSTFASSLPTGVTHLLVSLAYSFGFLLLIIGRSELFTEHTTIAILPLLDRRVRLVDLLRLWGCVYLGNLLGAILSGSLAAWFGLRLGVAATADFSLIAHGLTDDSAVVTLAGSTLSGYLMGELAWLMGAGRDTSSQILLIALITSAIGFLEIHHVVAGAAEVAAGVWVDPTLTSGSLLRLVALATVGNSVGGVLFVALIKYGHAVRSGD